MHAVSARTGERRMQENTNVATLVELRKREPVGRMTIGIDLGDRKSHFCVLNEQAQVIARGFLPTTITAFRREFESLPPSLVAIEAGAHSLWANQVLRVCGHEVLVGKPRKIRLITESDRKSDRVDAESLARLASKDMLMISVWTTKHIPPQTGKRINCAGEQFTWTKNLLFVEMDARVISAFFPLANVSSAVVAEKP